MPVLDHEVHPSTVGGKLYGCWGKVREQGYYAPDLSVRISPPTPRWRFIHNMMSQSCRYDASLTDSKCEGCTHCGGGEEYARFMLENAA